MPMPNFMQNILGTGQQGQVNRLMGGMPEFQSGLLSQKGLGAIAEGMAGYGDQMSNREQPDIAGDYHRMLLARKLQGQY